MCLCCVLRRPGHWFTFSVTLLTFAVIIAHLLSYQKYCRSSGHLLALFIGWSAFYTMCALSVLKKTQEAFHDSVEAVDGIRQSLPAFPIYMLLFIALQYITFITTDSEGERESGPQVVEHSSSQSTSSSTVPSPSATTEKERPLERPVERPAVAPVISSPVTAVPDAPSMPDIPDAPPPPPPSAPSMAKTTPSAPQITSRKPKASTPLPPPPVDSRSALLGDISAGKAHLRPVKGQSIRAPTAASGLEKWLADARKVLQPDGEEEKEDEKWE